MCYVFKDRKVYSLFRSTDATSGATILLTLTHYKLAQTLSGMEFGLCDRIDF